MLDRREPTATVEKRVDDALTILKTTPVERTRDLVNGVLTHRTFTLRFLDHGEKISSISSYFVDKTSVPGVHIPTIVLDPARIQQAHENVVAADLVRSFALVAAYPESEKERVVATYNRAMDEQQHWLDDPRNTHRPQRTVYDPHINRDHMISGLLGTSRFYYDAGFSDWETAVEELAVYYQKDPHIVAVLDQWQHAPEKFIAMRDTYQKRVHDAYGKDLTAFTTLSADDRALFTASAYVRHAIGEEESKRKQSRV